MLNHVNCLAIVASANHSSSVTANARKARILPTWADSWQHSTPTWPVSMPRDSLVRRVTSSSVSSTSRLRTSGAYSYGQKKFDILKNSDVHAHARLRINGVVMNTDLWYDLYNVDRNNLLYLPVERRAYIW